MNDGVTRVPVRKVDAGSAVARAYVDTLAVEEPLEIRLVYQGEPATRSSPGGERHERTIAVTMRTPGQDAELALGFLFGEGIVRGRDDVASWQTAKGTVRIALADGVRVDLRALERNFYVSSSCGVCGKASIDAVRVRRSFVLPEGPRIDPRCIVAIPAALREAQTAFQSTGGIHGAGLFDAAGTLHDSREDVGRHNAVDKLIGAALLRGDVPLGERVLSLSGRASFELVQKAAMAGVPAVVAVGAPSSLAVELAHDTGMTLIGFVRDRQFNVYAGAQRVSGGF